MKNRFHSSLTGSLVSISCLAALSLALIPPNTLVDDSPTLFNGQIELPVKGDISLPKIQSDPGLSPVFTKNASKSEPTLIAIGGKLMAGYRDGGLYRAGQLTAFPNLLAQQMGLTKFKTPLFEPAEGNGTGYQVIDVTQRLPTWKRVVNNLGVLESKPFRLSKYRQGIPQNLAFPELSLQLKQFTNPNSSFPAYPQRYDYTGYFYRILSEQQEGQTSLADLLPAMNADVALYQDGYDLYLGLAQFPRSVTTETSGLMSSFVPSIAHKTIRQLVDKGTKVILFTIPQVLALPYFQTYPISKLLNEGKEVYARSHNNHPTPRKLDNRAILVPTDAVRALLLGRSTVGLSYEKPLADEDVITEEEVAGLRTVLSYNELFVRQAARQFNLPVVDLEAIYKQILSNQYTTDDGLFIDPTFPTGNFFSSDGMNPSAVGQAVIANETIKVINHQYRTNIPLIQVKQWATIAK